MMNKYCPTAKCQTATYITTIVYITFLSIEQVNNVPPSFIFNKIHNCCSIKWSHVYDVIVKSAIGCCMIDSHPGGHKRHVVVAAVSGYSVECEVRNVATHRKHIVL